MKSIDKGYSGTPLIKKLGLREETAAVLINSPEGYINLLGKLPHGVTLTNKLTNHSSFIHYFTKNKAELAKKFQALKKSLKPDGMLWISWPKKSSGIPTDLNENVIREIALKNGLVDIKVCAIDEEWSALKLVYRLKDR